MIARCRARQHNVLANDGTRESVMDTPYNAPDIEPFVADVYPLPACSALAEEAKRLGLAD